MTAEIYQALTPGVSLSKIAAIFAHEAKTHTHLAPGTPLKAGDIYGGDDWGFVYAVGSPQCESPKPGDKCPQSAYRFRRPRA